jgi:hypothetical protein
MPGAKGPYPSEIAGCTRVGCLRFAPAGWGAAEPYFAGALVAHHEKGGSASDQRAVFELTTEMS